MRASSCARARALLCCASCRCLSIVSSRTGRRRIFLSTRRRRLWFRRHSFLCRSPVRKLASFSPAIPSSSVPTCTRKRLRKLVCESLCSKCGWITQRKKSLEASGTARNSERATARIPTSSRCHRECFTTVPWRVARRRQTRICQRIGRTFLEARATDARVVSSSTASRDDSAEKATRAAGPIRSNAPNWSTYSKPYWIARTSHPPTSP
mmetsp:Transcript_7352/g.29534  ORF Transcript_7352/g.29534 Transcript_7352/m.29534 type:complete len:209 (-) Transcript_7352:651-1277(-)